MSDLLLVFNPRNIEECVDSIAALPIDKAWLKGYTEAELVPVIADVIGHTRYDNYIAISDDGIVPHRALGAVRGELRGAKGAVTGYCNLSQADWRVNLTRSPLRTPTPQIASYDLYDWAEVWDGDEIIDTYFAGMCLTGMSRQTWQRFPFQVFGAERGGYGSDYSLSLRLQEAGVPIVAPRDAFVLHVKEVWNRADTDPRKAKVPQEKRVVMERGE